MQPSDYASTAFGEARRTVGRHGYVAYFPSEIPRQIHLPPATISLLAEAEASLGGLAAIGKFLPNPHLLVRPYLIREAVSSTRIEGTRASMTDLFELDAVGGEPNADVEEVLAYMNALELGLERLRELPLSTRLMREMHKRLLAGVRGRDRTPGELRLSPNWIGGAGSTLESAHFVPPPPEELPRLLEDWERFAHEDAEMPLLVQNALLHYQFETLHPFLDGNGRLGRLLVVFFLVARRRLTAPLLYVSSYLEQDRNRYYEGLQAVRETGDPVPWIEMFLEAIRSQSIDALERAQRIVELREDYRAKATGISSGNVAPLIDLICKSPILTARLVRSRLDVSHPTALTLLRRMKEVGVLIEGDTGLRGQRRYFANELLDVLSDRAAAR